MGSPENKDDRPLLPHFVDYDHLNPSPHFSQEQIAYIESIRSDFSESDLQKIRELEWFRLNLKVSGMGSGVIPGLRQKLGVGALYIRRFSDQKYEQMMDTFLDFVPEGFPQDDLYKCNMPPYRVTIPSGDRYYPIVFHGDVEIWCKRLVQAAVEYHTLTGQFDRGKFILSDGQGFAFTALTVETLNARPYPRTW